MADTKKKVLSKDVMRKKAFDRWENEGGRPPAKTPNIDPAKQSKKKTSKNISKKR